MSIVFHSAKVQKLLKHMETLFSCNVYVVNANGKKRMTCSRKEKTGFCLKLKENPEYAKRCAVCDEKLMKVCEETGEPVFHFCHAGLWDGLIPVKDGKEIVGYIFYGKLRKKGSKCPEEYRQLGLAEEYEKLPTYTEQEIEAIHYLLSQIDFFHYMQLEEDDGLLEKIHTYIQDHLAEDLSAEMLCQKFHISKSQLYRIFSVGYSGGINQYITTARIHTARKWIRETGEPISQIAEKVGIYDAIYFTKMFKEIVGVTPKEYRKRTS